MKYTSAIVTLSDSGYAGVREDISKTVIAKILEANNFEIVSYTLLPDDYDQIIANLNGLCESNINLIVTTGGTGFSPRDITPEATKKVIEREACGVMEAIRYNGMQFTPRAMLTRGICGIKKQSIIINLPGSPKACEENLSFVLPALIHGLDTLLGNSQNCGRK